MSAWREFLTWIEQTALGHAIRDSGVWTYGLINLTHILGVAALFGSILVLDLRLLGWRRDAGLGQVATATIPVAVTGFCIAAASGLCLLATNGSEYIGNPFLPIKFGAIACGLGNALIVGSLPAWGNRDAASLSSREKMQFSLLGGISLVCWVAAVGAGRMIGYW